MAGVVALAGASLGDGAQAARSDVSDYPTVARADYVFACMQVNGITRLALEKCSCSIDTIAELLPFDAYEEAETVMSVRQKGGEKTSMFLSYAPLREKVKKLKRAQVEAELRCF
jgi:hypothetical protein